jgi:hypothetical protein
VVIVHVLDGFTVAPIEPPLNEVSVIVSQFSGGVRVPRRWEIRPSHLVLQQVVDNLDALRVRASSILYCHRTCRMVDRGFFHNQQGLYSTNHVRSIRMFLHSMSSPAPSSLLCPLRNLGSFLGVNCFGNSVLSTQEFISTSGVHSKIGVGTR